jgi:hypothetical protein
LEGNATEKLSQKSISKHAQLIIRSSGVACKL